MDRKNREFILENEDSWSEQMPLIERHLGNKRILLLKGELGSGKTTFVNFLLKQLGCDVAVDSPSFAIVNEYDCPSLIDRYGSRKVYHLDLYRIEDPEELIEAGIEEMFYKPGLKLIEWPEIATSALPGDYKELNFSYFGTGRKLIVL